MENGFKKFAKGIFAIFIIKLMFVFLVLLNQACNNENIEIKNYDYVTTEFSKSLENSKLNLSKIRINKEKLSYRKSSNYNDDEETFIVSLVQVNTMANPVINNFNNAIEYLLSGDYYMTNTECPDVIDNTCIPLYANQQAIDNSLEPSIIAAKNYLKVVHDFFDNDIIEILDSNNEAILVPIVQYIIEENVNQQSLQGSTNSKNFNFLMQNAYAAKQNSESKAWSCFKSAVGYDLLVNGLHILYNYHVENIAMTIAEKEAKKQAKKALIKSIITQLGGKLVGGTFGLAVATFNFTMCMMN